MLVHTPYPPTRHDTHASFPPTPTHPAALPPLQVVPPFQLLPREVLVGTCNGVLRGLVSSLLPLFMRQLSADYERWAQDPAYRAERAQRSKPLA